MGRTILISELPRFVPPMLAKPGEPFDSLEHLFEIKWDGTRALAFTDTHSYRLVNRHRADVTERYPELGIAFGHVGPVAVDQAVTVSIGEGQGASAVPFNLKEMFQGIKRLPRLGQHRRHKPGEFRDQDRPAHDHLSGDLADQPAGGLPVLGSVDPPGPSHALPEGFDNVDHLRSFRRGMCYDFLAGHPGLDQ